MRLAVTVLVAATSLSGVAAHAGASTSRHCAQSGVRELAADLRGRMYQDRKGTQAVYVCLRSRDRPVLFAEEDPDLSDEAVTSPYAAGVLFSESSLAPEYLLTIVDMRGRKATSESLASPVRDLVLTKHGTVGYILAAPWNPDGTGPVGPARVQRKDINGALVELDVGNVSQLALSADGRRLYWLKDGVVQTAPI